jgi:hypothetical protein
VKEHNRHRLALITGRYATRLAEKQAASAQAFDDAFRAVREAIIRPVLEEAAAELRGAGHAPRVTIDGSEERPSIELHLGMRGLPDIPEKNLIAFSVIRRREAPEVLAYLVVRPPPMDLVRFADPSEITAETVEQLVIDSIEHIFACHSV